MSKQLQKLNYAPVEVEINVVGSGTPTSGSLTITQIKTLLASDQNYIKYTIAANMSEYLYFSNFTNNTAFYGADLYNATTSVYYRHLIKISYSSDLSSATWNYYNIPIITGSSSDLQEKLVSGTNIKTINGNNVLGSGDLDTNSNLANTYSSSSAYSVGSYVIYNHQLYKCKTAIASGGEAWNSAHWNLVKVGSQLTSKQDVLDDQELYQDGPIYNSVVGFNSSANLCSGQVPHTAISSTGATNGQVLTADGSGGCAWANAGGVGGETYIMTGGYITLTGNIASNCIWYYDNTGIVKLNSPLASTYFDNTDKLYFSYMSIRYVTITTNKEVDVIYSNTEQEIYKITIPANTPTTLNAFYGADASGYILFKNVGTSITFEYYED